MLRRILIAALLLASPLYAQYGTVYAPEVHLGSATEPSTITVPPIEYIPGGAAYEPEVSNATPADTELLAERHWDFITSPMSGVAFWSQGSMADHSVSLGEYARHLRSGKPTLPSHVTPKPNSTLPSTR